MESTFFVLRGVGISSPALVSTLLLVAIVEYTINFSTGAKYHMIRGRIWTPVCTRYVQLDKVTKPVEYSENLSANMCDIGVASDCC